MMNEAAHVYERDIRRNSDDVKYIQTEQYWHLSDFIDWG